MSVIDESGCTGYGVVERQVDSLVKPDFPICQTGKKIPWSIAERDYEGYVKRYGKCQTLERLAERGGFYVEEMDQLYPAWREEVEEVYLLRKKNVRLLEALERIGNILATIPALELNPEDESDLQNSQQALFEIAIIREQAVSV